MGQQSQESPPVHLYAVFLQVHGGRKQDKNASTLGDELYGASIETEPAFDTHSFDTSFKAGGVSYCSQEKVV